MTPYNVALSQRVSTPEIIILRPSGIFIPYYHYQCEVRSWTLPAISRYDIPSDTLDVGHSENDTELEADHEISRRVAVDRKLVSISPRRRVIK